jgi:hypothetical protein
MINLIPPTAQKQVTREYKIRVVSVWLFLLGFACLVVAIFNIPVYVLVQSQLSTYLQEFTLASNQSDSFKSSEATITKANAIATLLTKAEQSTTFSDVINELEKQASAGGGVTITSFNFLLKDGVLTPVVISGTADSRLLLSEFRDALAKNPRFENATLPLSSLAKDRDVPFSITLTPRAAVKQ